MAIGTFREVSQLFRRNRFHLFDLPYAPLFGTGVAGIGLDASGSMVSMFEKAMKASLSQSSTYGLRHCYLDGVTAVRPDRAGTVTSRGFIKGSFVVPLDSCYAFESELLGAITAIECARDFGWDHLWLECDSTYVVNLLTRREEVVPWVYKSRWVNRLLYVSIHSGFSHLEEEIRLDLLSKIAVSSTGVQWWWGLPDSYVLTTVTYEDDQDMVKLALLYFFETAVLSKERPMLVWGYETISSLTETFGIKSSTSICPRMLNWIISGMTNKSNLGGYLWWMGLHEMPLIATVHHTGGRKPSDIASVVEDKSDVHDHTDRSSPIASLVVATSPATSDAYHPHSAPYAYDAHRMYDHRIDHAANHLVPPVPISSSPIAKFEHSMNVFNQMSDRKLADNRRKRRCGKTIKSPYDCQSLCRKMIRTLPMLGSVKFDPYCPVPNEVTRQYAHFMDTSADN
ncbi:hypothetical protein FNV43_RR05663 [Rhamnella rubrinervis]|uniref:RNase H type-1 domain-containing protein n=1 Tax=Rhamnella rubrinervis TaxID=2594499 RepID=A0A8K0HMJ8_9ROSA|nr:hypothetical protein FNV43_RR05663 [Rhamnella rubrinervis]